MAASKYPWRPQYDDVIHDNNDDDFDDKEYCSTSHKNRGGQLKGREPKFQEGDVVEVLYVEDEDDEEEEREWYEATITKRVDYEDDIRLVFEAANAFVGRDSLFSIHAVVWTVMPM